MRKMLAYTKKTSLKPILLINKNKSLRLKSKIKTNKKKLKKAR